MLAAKKDAARQSEWTSAWGLRLPESRLSATGPSAANQYADERPVSACSSAAVNVASCVRSATEHYAGIEDIDRLPVFFASEPALNCSCE